jgi:hypothetical protein
MNNDTGKIIIGIGAIVIIIGLIVYFFGDKLHFIGNLPGDIRVEKENSRFYFPITTMILFSIVLNIIIRVIRYFFP